MKSSADVLAEEYGATTIDRQDWAGIAAQLDADGYALLPGLLDRNAARGLARLAGTLREAGYEQPPDNPPGRGEWLYFGSRLPAPWTAWREAFYRCLAVVANRRNERLGIENRYPDELDAFLRRNREAGQRRPQSHLSRLGVDDYVLLHQRAEGWQVFPMQLAALLSEPGEDFEGGEFVMTEQRPRMQSRPIVAPLRLGDVAVVATAGWPREGARGAYRVSFRHAVSRVRRGERIGMEVFFHDAP